MPLVTMLTEARMRGHKGMRPSEGATVVGWPIPELTAVRSRSSCAALSNSPRSTAAAVSLSLQKIWRKSLEHHLNEH